MVELPVRLKRFPSRVLGRTLHPLVVSLAAKRLRRLAQAGGSLDEALDLAYSFRFLGITIAPWQERSELRELLELVEELAPSTVLEIGTANGGTLFLLARAAAPNAHLVSVDLPQGEFGGGYPRWRGVLYRSFAADGQAVTLLRGDSHARETAQQVAKTLAGVPLELLFIDGDHSYDGVKRDFETYTSLLSESGVVALHDIVPGMAHIDDSIVPGRADVFLVGEVPAYWDELKRSREVREFVADWGQGSFGIGVVLPRASEVGS